MANVNPDQALLSEQLALLRKLGFSEEKIPREALLHELKLLDAIALLMCTGQPGEHFAVAFDKRQGLEVILAKNGAVTSEDIAAAKEFFSNLCDPEITHAEDLFPFIARHCQANLVKHIRQLRACIIDTGFRDDFYSRLDESTGTHRLLSPDAMKTQFPRDTDSIAEKYADVPLSAILRDLFDGIVKATMVSDAPDLAEFAGLYDFALPLAYCRFLDMWPMRNKPVLEKAQRFQRRAKKLLRYVRDVNALLKGAKRLGGPIKHRWVTDESLGDQLKEDDIQFNAVTPLEAARHSRLLSPEELSVLEMRFPGVVKPWQRSVHTSLHAELRIILHFDKASGIRDYYRPMGVSKPSCLCCQLWMEEYCCHHSICWVTRSRGKGDATWALTAHACPNIQDPDLKGFDRRVVAEVGPRWRGRIYFSSMTEYVDESFTRIKLI